MNLKDFNFYLPEELIAQSPVSGPRDHSRLMVLDRVSGTMQHKHFYDIVQFLRAGDLLVFNNSKVLPARLFGRKTSSGGHIEILLVRPRQEQAERNDVTVWEAMIRWKKAQPGAQFEVLDNAEQMRMTGSLLEAVQHHGESAGTWLVAFDANTDTFEQLLTEIGHMPIPPYIRHNAMSEEELREKYQTVYAKVNGSVAAPTAGLHFTPELLQKLDAMGVERAEVTLHVGLGTFQPIKTDDISKHQMHAEQIEISEEAAVQINTARAEGRRVIAVGTTSVRVLESMAENGQVHADTKETEIFITPGYEFQIVDGLITNFHLPKSTLLLLVSALAGKENMSHAYQEAIAQKYRFFSFGDAMLIL